MHSFVIIFGETKGQFWRLYTWAAHHSLVMRGGCGQKDQSIKAKRHPWEEELGRPPPTLAPVLRANFAAYQARLMPTRGAKRDTITRIYKIICRKSRRLMPRAYSDRRICDAILIAF